MITQSQVQFPSVYGPVNSWRYGRSLGIDPIGMISSCSFNCVYCQLGEIERLSCDRSLFVPTSEIIRELKGYTPWDVDIITLSGSGEPTLALNLGEIIAQIKNLTHRPVLVLTNGTLLNQATVRKDLALADQVSVKLDGISPEKLQRINRPLSQLNWSEILQGIKLFRNEYQGNFGIQTMVLTEWDYLTLNQYLALIKDIKPDEIQLNTPSRPKPLQRQLDGRGNHSSEDQRHYEVRLLKCVSSETIENLAHQIQQETAIKVRYKTENFF
jgi:wyosine [tRNA(Phe)-imidazoG37] synthetase (radical SAM superfamily)